MNMDPKVFFNTYGTHIVTQYDAGGEAYTSYEGTDTANSAKSEFDIETNAEVGVSTEKIASVNVAVSASGGENHEESFANNNKQMSMRVRGGDPMYSTFDKIISGDADATVNAWLASMYGKDFVVSEIEKICGAVEFDRCPTEAATVLAIRARVNELIDLQVSRKKLGKKYLGKTVKIKIDRPVGYVHKKGEKTLVYPINYGYIEGVLGGDGEELDVYLLGTDNPVAEAKCRIIGIVRRENDVEDKLVGAPEGMSFTSEEIAAAVNFQEKYYVSRIETM
jgi:inorganic pyrophosphatase